MQVPGRSIAASLTRSSQCCFTSVAACLRPRTSVLRPEAHGAPFASQILRDDLGPATAPKRHFTAPKLVCRAVTETDATEVPSSSTDTTTKSQRFRLCCPICYSTEFAMDQLPTSSQGLSCPRCSRTFDSDNRYIDLTLTSGVNQKVRALMVGCMEVGLSLLLHCFSGVL